MFEINRIMMYDTGIKFDVRINLKTKQLKLNIKKEPQPASCDTNIFLLTIVYHSQLFFKSVEAKLRTLIDGN